MQTRRCSRRQSNSMDEKKSSTDVESSVEPDYISRHQSLARKKMSLHLGRAVSCEEISSKVKNRDTRCETQLPFINVTRYAGGHARLKHVPSISSSLFSSRGLIIASPIGSISHPDGMSNEPLLFGVGGRGCIVACSVPPPPLETMIICNFNF